MENHPIPQDVTGFKFKLIGSVTVKQFLYILGGGILAGICFILPINGFIRIPLAILFGGIGTAMAFIPIEGRPMDVMIKNFLKALPSENQYIFKKTGAQALIAEFFSAPPVVKTDIVVPETAASEKDSKRALLYSTLKLSSSYRPDEKEQTVLSNINSYFNETSHPATPPIQQNVDMMPQEIIEPTLIPQPKETLIARPSPAPKAAEAVPAPLPKETMPASAIAPILKPSIQPNISQNVTTVPPVNQLKAGFPQLPDIPNIVLGIIKDPRGKVLPNVLVEIMSQQGVPVRAFKTNALGQFTAATPLTNGEYEVILEDPKKANEFEKIHIALDGSIFEPLEINSVDAREKLRRELFGNAQNAGAQIVT